MTVEAYNLLGKIRTADDALDPPRQRRVVEAHPELAFMRLAGEAIAAGKKTPPGRERRRKLLRAAAGWALDPGDERERLGRTAVAVDDILDAVALVLTARRMGLGEAECLGSHDRDARGLEMAIYY